MPSIRLRLPAALLAAVVPGMASPPPAVEAARLRALLEEMHPGYRSVIQTVRPATSAGGIYLGLVRPGGRDPRHPEDLPIPGPTRRYDLLVGEAPARGPRGMAWTRALLDHEYYHARHLSRTLPAPLPAFGSARADRHFREAMAWGHNLREAARGAYGELRAPERREMRGRYQEHREALRRWVAHRQPAAWGYYGRLLPEDPAAAPAVVTAGAR